MCFLLKLSLLSYECSVYIITRTQGSATHKRFMKKVWNEAEGIITLFRPSVKTAIILSGMKQTLVHTYTHK